MASLDRQLKSMYQRVLDSTRGGVLVGAGRPPKYIRHCVSSDVGPSGKKRCKKMAPGPRAPPMGAGRSGGGVHRSCAVKGQKPCRKQVRNGPAYQSPAQKAWRDKLRAYREATGASLKEAMIYLKGQ